MSLWEKLTLWFRPRERAFRTDLDKICESRIDPLVEYSDSPEPGDIYKSDDGEMYLADEHGRFQRMEDNPPRRARKKNNESRKI